MLFSASAVLAAGLFTPLPVAALERGLAWGTDDRWAPTIARGLVSWYHHWQDGPNPNMPSDVEYVPMFWGPSKSDLWNTRKSEMANNLPTHILSFNEPDITGQSNMGPAAAAQLHMQELQPYAAKGVKISSPNIVWNVQWMDSFMSECNKLGCTIDFIGIHWYGSYNDIETFKTWVTTMHTRFNKNIWVTEYGVTASSGGTQDQIKAFHIAATSWLETQTYVERAAWLGCYSVSSPPDNYVSNKSGFFNAAGTLRDMAYWYVYTSSIPASKRSTRMFARHRNVRKLVAPTDLVYGDFDDDAYNNWLDEAHCDQICKQRNNQLSKTKPSA